jgi:hypothetical protein
MVRLAHIALFMLPLINVVLGGHLDGLNLSRRWKEVCSWSAIIGMIGIPLGLTLGALIDLRLKYVAGPATQALLLSLVLMGVGSVRKQLSPGQERP